MDLERESGSLEGISATSVALLPLGSLEAHGKHLPLGTDALIPTELAKRIAAEVAGVICLPTVPYGVSWAYEDAGYFTLSLSSATMADVIVEILDGVVRNGVTRILVVNGHDGNVPAIEVAASRIYRQHGVTIAAFESWWLALPGLLGKTPPGIGHAGVPETALMLAAAPDAVHMGETGPLPAAPELRYGRALTGIRLFAPIAYRFPGGRFTDATGATPEMGEEWYALLVRHAVEFLEFAAEREWKFRP